MFATIDPNSGLPWPSPAVRVEGEGNTEKKEGQTGWAGGEPYAFFSFFYINTVICH